MDVTQQMENKLTANMNLRKRDIIWGNFLGGMFWGIGSVIGIAVVTAVIGLALNALGVFSAIGSAFGTLGSITQQLQNIPQIPTDLY